MTSYKEALTRMRACDQRHMVRQAGFMHQWLLGRFQKQEALVDLLTLENQQLKAFAEDMVDAVERGDYGFKRVVEVGIHPQVMRTLLALTT